MPRRRNPQDGLALARRRVVAVQRQRGHDLQKRLRAGPMGRMARDVQFRNRLGRDGFVLHFGEQAQQAFGQIKPGRCRRKVRLSGQQAPDQTGKLQPAPQVRNGARQIGQNRVVLQLGHHVHAGQKGHAVGCENLGHPAAHALAVQEQPHPRHGLRALTGQPLFQATHQFQGEIHTRRQVEQAVAFMHPATLPASPRPWQSLPAARRRTSPRRAPRQKPCRQRSSGPTGGSAKRPARGNRPAVPCG